MKCCNRILSLLLTVLMTLSLAIAVFAVPDLSKTGTIRIYLTDSDDRPVSGGTLTIYKVGNVYADDADFSFVLTDDFAGSGESLENVGSASLAKRLANYADKYRLTCTTKTIGLDGRVVFDELEPGLYLLVQYNAADGYYLLDPFLVSIPQFIGDEYIYDVDAGPKVEAESKPGQNPPKETESGETEPKETKPGETKPNESKPGESEPSETKPNETKPKETEPEEIETGRNEPDETVPGKPDTTPEEPKLPQTGQLKWPIPILVVTGLVFFLIGWVLCFRKKDTDEK